MISRGGFVFTGTCQNDSSFSLRSQLQYCVGGVLWKGDLPTVTGLFYVGRFLRERRVDG